MVPLRYRSDEGDKNDKGELSFISLTTILGTPMDVTVEELAIESFYPADERTAAALTPSTLLTARRYHPPGHRAIAAEDTDAIAAEGQAPRLRGTGGARPRCPFRPGIVMLGGRACTRLVRAN